MRQDPHIVIVGAGFAGLRVAKGLDGAPTQITVVDRRNHHLFLPLLYQVATAALSPASVATPIRSILRGQRNVDVMLAEVQGIDPVAKVVRTSTRALSYDYLVIATGARYQYYNHPEWQAIAPPPQSIEDAVAIRHKILLAFEMAELEEDPAKRQIWLTFVVIGGGPTGVEMAGAIGELARKALASDFRHIDPRHARIILVEAGPRILSSFPVELSEKAVVALRRLGVEVRCGSAVEQIDAEGLVLRGERIEAKTSIWAAGTVVPPIAEWLGARADRSGRVYVEPDLSVPGHPEVFVAGDAAHLEVAGQPLPAVAPVAMQQGAHLARVLRDRLRGKKASAPFHYVNKGNLATVGRSFAVADFGSVRLSGFLAWLVWVVVHIYYLIGFRNRLIVMLEWIWAYVTFQRGARLITK